MAAESRLKVGGILETRNMCLVGVMSAPDRPGLVSAIFQMLGRENVNAPFIVQSIDLNHESHVQFCVAEVDRERVLQVLQPVSEAVRARKVVEVHPVAVLAVFGPDFRERPGIAGRAFAACAGAGVNILAVSTSISTISWVISEGDLPSARQALHEVFALP